jgi:phosphatidylinositol alpha-1,6-mannosyltransferase
MRILFLTDKFAPERGGSQIIFANAYHHLPEHEVVVLTRDFPGAAEFDASYRHRVVRLPFPTVPKLRSALFNFQLLAAARRLCQTERFDQVHGGQALETGSAALAVARRQNLPLVLHTFAEDITSFEKHRLLGPPMRRALRNAVALSTISRFTLERLKGQGVSEERISLLYPGLAPDDWVEHSGAAAIRSQFGLNGKKVILTVSRLISRKGQDTVLRALPRVLERVPQVVYLIAGDGPERPRLEKLTADLGIQAHVRFAGSIANKDALHFYHACDVFAMPNREMPNGDIEGFGLVFLEANACGKPVIGGRSGGATDAIVDAETGFLVDPESPTEIADRLIQLLSDPERAAAMGAAGKQRVRSSFTWEHTGQALHRIVAAAAAP